MIKIIDYSMNPASYYELNKHLTTCVLSYFLSWYIKSSSDEKFKKKTRWPHPTKYESSRNTSSNSDHIRMNPELKQRQETRLGHDFIRKNDNQWGTAAASSVVSVTVYTQMRIISSDCDIWTDMLARIPLSTVHRPAPFTASEAAPGSMSRM